MGVWQDFPGEIKHTHLLTPDWEPTADQSMDPTKVRLGELMDFMIFFIGISIKSYRQEKNDSKTAAYAKSIKARNPKHTEQPAGSLRVERYPFQVALLVWDYSRQHGWFLTLLSPLSEFSLQLGLFRSSSEELLLVTLSREESSDSYQFQGLPEAI